MVVNVNGKLNTYLLIYLRLLSHLHTNIPAAIFFNYILHVQHKCVYVAAEIASASLSAAITKNEENDFKRVSIARLETSYISHFTSFFFHR